MIVYQGMEGGGWNEPLLDASHDSYVRTTLGQFFDEVISIDAEIELLRRQLAQLTSAQHLEVFDNIRQLQPNEERGIGVGSLIAFLQ